MSQLQDNLNAILTQKNTYLIPANIRAGVEVLGVTGNLDNVTLDLTSDSNISVSGETLVIIEGHPEIS